MASDRTVMTQAEFKAMLAKLSSSDLESWMNDIAMFGSGAIQTDKDGNVSYVPFLTVYKMEENDRGKESN